MKQLNVTLIFPSLIWPGAVIFLQTRVALSGLTYGTSFPLFPDCERQSLKTFWCGCRDCFAAPPKLISFQVVRGTEQLIELRGCLQL